MNIATSKGISEHHFPVDFASAAPSSVALSAASASTASKQCAAELPRIALHQLEMRCGVAASASARSATASAHSSPAPPSIAAQQATGQTAATRFRLPNDIWTSVTAFLPLQDVVNLRATSKEINVQVDAAISTLKVRGVDLERFLNSSSLKHIKTLCLEDIRIDQLRLLAQHLHARPGPKLNLTLQGHYETNAAGLQPLTELPLATLALNGFSPHSAPATLTACAFPLALSGTFSRETLLAAVSIPTLDALTTDALYLDADIARRLATHPALRLLSIEDAWHAAEPLKALATCPFSVEVSGHLSADVLMAAAGIPTLKKLVTVCFGMNVEIAAGLSKLTALHMLAFVMHHQTPPQTLQLLAAIPSLRALSVEDFDYGIFDPGIFDVDSVHILASNANLETLTTDNLSITEESFNVLSQAQTLTTLSTSLRSNMLALGNMQFLRNLTFNNPLCVHVSTTLDAASAQSIASLSALRSISFPAMLHSGDALASIFEKTNATTIAFTGDVKFFPNALSALTANNKLKSLTFTQCELTPEVHYAALHHPTIDRVVLHDTAFRRRPGHPFLIPISTKDA